MIRTFTFNFDLSLLRCYYNNDWTRGMIIIIIYYLCFSRLQSKLKTIGNSYEIYSCARKWNITLYKIFQNQKNQMLSINIHDRGAYTNFFFRFKFKVNVYFEFTN